MQLVKVVVTNREGHREPRREAHSRSGTIKPQGEVWGNGCIWGTVDPRQRPQPYPTFNESCLADDLKVRTARWDYTGLPGSTDSVGCIGWRD
jgi:hypothetical protein